MANDTEGVGQSPALLGREVAVRGGKGQHLSLSLPSLVPSAFVFEGEMGLIRMTC